MNKNKIILILVFLILLIIGIDMFLVIKNKFIDGKSDSQKYFCSSITGNNDKITLESTYEFVYENNMVKDMQRALIVTYKEENEYYEAYYDKFFAENDPPYSIETDSESLVRKYIWHDGLSFDSEKDTLDFYLKLYENKGYSCSKKA